MSFRVTAQFREALMLAAVAEHRSLSNALHVIIFDWCQRKGIELPGAMKPNQSVTSKPGTPASPIIGRSGAAAERFALVIAMPRSAPD
jgi:hypothetical protein